MVDEQQKKYDIFLSYRHLSDMGGDQWVTTFCENLNILLEESLGKKVDIFFDKFELRAGDKWRSEIDRALESAPIFLAIIVQSYFESVVCRQEMDRFLGLYKQANDATPRLIFPIFKQPPPPDLPPEIDEVHRPRKFYRDTRYSLSSAAYLGTDRLR